LGTGKGGSAVYVVARNDAEATAKVWRCRLIVSKTELKSV
jgi:hypothetical protein